MIAADALLDTLQAWGVDHFFGCPGSTEAAILDALVGREEPRFILATHEITAVSAAEGWARASGRPGVALLHANVGLGNAVSQLHAAKMAQVPLVAINCIKPRAILGRGGFTTAHDHQEMVKQYTNWDWQVLSEQTLVEDLERALRLAMTPPMGPTYLAIPEDILGAAIGEQQIAGPYQYDLRSQAPAHGVRQAAEMLAEADFPLIISGAGVAQEDAHLAVIKLADQLAAPVCCENRLQLDYCAYPTEDSHFVGPFQPEADFVRRADLILALGCKLFVEFVPPEQPWIPPNTKLIHLYCDATQIGNIYRPELGLCGSVKAGLEEICANLDRLPAGNQAQIATRKEAVAKLHDAVIRRREAAFEAVRNSHPLQVTHLARELARVVNAETCIVLDSPTANEIITDYVPRDNVRSYYGSATGGSLGWAMGAALGIKFAAPERRVICVVGDGVSIFGMPALHMAAKYQLPVIFIVINNASYAAVKAGLIRYRGKAVEKDIFLGSDIGGPEYATIAEGFGVSAFKIASERDLPRLAEAIKNSDEPLLIDFVIDPMDLGRTVK